MTSPPLQQPQWPDRGGLKTVVHSLEGLPPLVLTPECNQLKKRLPRSAATEVRDGVELRVYRGDAVNGIEFTAAARTPDPHRLLEAYHCSVAMLNL